MDETFKVLHTYKFESKDYQVTSASPWNYALFLPSDQETNQTLSVVVRGMQQGHHPFSFEGTPVMINAKVSGKEVYSTSVPFHPLYKGHHFNSRQYRGVLLYSETCIHVQPCTDVKAQ